MSGIKETTDVLKFATSLLTQVAAANADGKLDGIEIANIAIRQMPAAIEAFSGAQNIRTELADLSDDELREIAEHGLAVALAVGAVFGVK